MDLAGQRLDKWLWFSRLVKTRSLASRLIASGKVRINKVKTVKPAQTIREGDVLTTSFHKTIKVIKVVKLGQRRGPAQEAQELYEDITPQDTEAASAKSQLTNRSQKAQQEIQRVVPAPAPKREKGMGRPTKRDRRKIEEFQQKR